MFIYSLWCFFCLFFFRNPFFRMSFLIKKTSPSNLCSFLFTSPFFLSPFLFRLFPIVFSILFLRTRETDPFFFWQEKHLPSRNLFSEFLLFNFFFWKFFPQKLLLQQTQFCPDLIWWYSFRVLKNMMLSTFFRKFFFFIKKTASWVFFIWKFIFTWILQKKSFLENPLDFLLYLLFGRRKYIFQLFSMFLSYYFFSSVFREFGWRFEILWKKGFVCSKTIIWILFKWKNHLPKKPPFKTFSGEYLFYNFLYFFGERGLFF